jgi:hypothetical protein
MRKTCDDTGPDRIRYLDEYNWDRLSNPLQGFGGRRSIYEDDFGVQRYQFLCQLWQTIVVVVRKPLLKLHIAPVCPAMVFKGPLKRGQPILPFSIGPHAMHQHADPSYPLRLLRPRR